jgi:hypothetical protein
VDLTAADSAAPRPSEATVLVPCGEVVQDAAQAKSLFAHTELLVYEEQQVRLRYLVTIQMD